MVKGVKKRDKGSLLNNDFAMVGRMDNSKE